LEENMSKEQPQSPTIKVNVRVMGQTLLFSVESEVTAEDLLDECRRRWGMLGEWELRYQDSLMEPKERLSKVLFGPGPHELSLSGAMVANDSDKDNMNG
jgi:hypothetical protein